MCLDKTIKQNKKQISLFFTYSIYDPNMNFRISKSVKEINI